MNNLKKTLDSPFVENGQAKLICFPHTITYKGIHVDYLHRTYRCLETGETFTTASVDDVNLKNIENQFNNL